MKTLLMALENLFINYLGILFVIAEIVYHKAYREKYGKIEDSKHAKRMRVFRVISVIGVFFSIQSHYLRSVLFDIANLNKTWLWIAIVCSIIAGYTFIIWCTFKSERKSDRYNMAISTLFILIGAILIPIMVSKLFAIDEIYRAQGVIDLTMLLSYPAVLMAAPSVLCGVSNFIVSKAIDMAKIRKLMINYLIIVLISCFFTFSLVYVNDAMFVKEEYMIEAEEGWNEHLEEVKDYQKIYAERGFIEETPNLKKRSIKWDEYIQLHITDYSIWFDFMGNKDDDKYGWKGPMKIEYSKDNNTFFIDTLKYDGHYVVLEENGYDKDVLEDTLRSKFNDSIIIVDRIDSNTMSKLITNKFSKMPWGVSKYNAKTNSFKVISKDTDTWIKNNLKK